MRYRKVINEHVAESTDGVAVAGSINAVVAVNVNEPGAHSHVSSRQRVRVVQRHGRTEVVETSHTFSQSDSAQATL